MLPYTTGRETWIGALSWTPDWRARQRLADGLIVDGTVRGQAARDFVSPTRARFVFVDCRPGLRDLEPELRPILESHAPLRLRQRLLGQGPPGHGARRRPARRVGAAQSGRPRAGTGEDCTIDDVVWP